MPLFLTACLLLDIRFLNKNLNVDVLIKSVVYALLPTENFIYIALEIDDQFIKFRYSFYGRFRTSLWFSTKQCGLSVTLPMRKLKIGYILKIYLHNWILLILTDLFVYFFILVLIFRAIFLHQFISLRIWINIYIVTQV